jgi:hypothetical protein
MIDDMEIGFLLCAHFFDSLLIAWAERPMSE